MAVPDDTGEIPSSAQRDIARNHPAPGKQDSGIGHDGSSSAKDTARPVHMPPPEASALLQQPHGKKPVRRRQRRVSRKSPRDRLERVLESVDTNVLAATTAASNETNGVASLDHSTYADAVKEGPVGATTDGAPDVTKGDNEDIESLEVVKTNGSAKGAGEQNKESTTSELDLPDKGASYPDVVKDGATKSEKANGHARGSAVQREGQTDANGSKERSWQETNSSVDDYPDLKDDLAVPEEEYERMRDRIAAAQVAGIRFAPLKVPLNRRMQTLAVLFHSLCMGTTVSIFFFLCALPFLWPIIIIYLISILFATDATDGRLRRRKEWFRRSVIWKYFAEYFPARLHKTHDLPPTRKYIFGYHPHGIISHGAWVAFASEALGFAEKFPGITNSLLTLDSNFRTPIYREYVFSMGCLSVSKESITNTLTKGGPNGEGMGRAVTIVIGGARESLEAQPGTMKLILKERKGFIKLAIRAGADLVPVVAFGENELYDQLQPHKHPYLHKIQRHFLKVWKFTVPLLHGRGIFNYDVGLMPYRRPMNIVVGKPIKVVQNINPDVDEVDRLHDLYTREVQKVWDRYKDEFAKNRKEELQILE